MRELILILLVLIVLASDCAGVPSEEPAEEIPVEEIRSKRRPLSPP